MIDWQRRRHPLDVPAPVAIALADFCRRAGAPASPALVREALSVLDEASDRQVLALSAGDPPVRPLGPLAVVDIIFGADPALAAQRQHAGYYERARPLPSAEPTPPVPLPHPHPSPKVAPPPPPPRPPEARRPQEPTLTEKIGPRRRAARVQPEPIPTPPTPAAPPPTGFRPKRSLPAPRGRFTRVDPSRAPMEMLLKLTAREEVEARADLAPTRVALRRALEVAYTGRRGAALHTEDVEAILSRHGLLVAMERKEREAIATAIRDAKGALGPAARHLLMGRAELERLIERLNLHRPGKELRRRSDEPKRPRRRS